ncbi:MAG: diguanylate cyclase [Oscillibacter sp.]|nr:diguanylate cyclase [Oscillibacter sp.]
MSYTSCVEIDIFAAAMLLIVFFSPRISLPHLAASQQFRLIVLLTTCVLCCDAASWVLMGRIFPGANELLWILNFFYFTLSGVIAFSWLIYTLTTLKHSLHLPPLAWIGMAVPLFSLIMLAMASFHHKWLFYIDQTNTYHRGPVFQMQTVVCFGYLLAASVIALGQMRRESLPEKRGRCLWMGSFVVMPLLGGTLEILHYGMLLLWPCAALSLELVYMSIQNQQISLDALTELNNRGQFDRHLFNRCNSYDGKSLLVLFLLDVDSFKRINDRWGHVVGDEALICGAQILKTVFAGRNAFLARYGGDEFAAILSCDSPDEIDNVLAALEVEEQAFNTAPDHLPYSLIFSIGYAQYDPKWQNDCARFIAAADAKMYQQKKERQDSESLQTVSSGPLRRRF